MNYIKLSAKNIQEIINFESINAPEKPYYSKYDTEALNYIFSNDKVCKAYGLFEDQEMIAWGAYRSYSENKFEISSIVVKKSHRHQKIGTNILKQLIESIKKEHKDGEIFLTVYPGNINALNLYIKNRFTIYDFKHDVYGPGADRLYLTYNKD